MKTKHFKKNITIVCAFLHLVVAHAQVFMFEQQPSQHSIVRQVADNQTLYYNQESAALASFILKTMDSSLAFHLPEGMRVNDFEIDDTMAAWFCGSFNGVPTVGHFHVPSVFNGSALLYYAICTDTDIQYLSFDRMDIMPLPPGRTALAIVGTMHRSSADPLVYPALFTATFNGSTYRIGSGCDTNRLVWPTDIAALDNMYVLVGTDINHRNCYLKTYERAPDPMYHPYQGENYLLLDHGDAGREDVLLSKTGASSVATLQYGADKTNLINHNITFNPAYGNIISIDSYEIKDLYPQPSNYDTAGMHLYDIRFSRGTRTAFVLHKGYHSSMPPSAFSLSSWILPVGSAIGSAVNLLEGHEYSLDTYRPSGFPITSGVAQDGITLNTYLHPYVLEGGCVRQTNVQGNLLNITIKKFEAPWNNDYNTQTIISFSPTITILDFNVKCN